MSDGLDRVDESSGAESSDVDQRVDDLGRHAGAALRHGAPVGGLEEALRRGRTQRRQRAAVRGGGILVALAALVGGSALRSGQDNAEQQPVITVPTTNAPRVATAVAESRIVFARLTDGSNGYSLFSMKDDGADEKLIHEDWEGIGISPDGATLVTSKVDTKGLLRPLLARMDETGESLLPVEDPTLNLAFGGWSPDGSRMVLEGWDETDDSRNGLYTSSLDGDLTRVSDAGDLQQIPSYPNAYSPDGDRLLYYERAQETRADQTFVPGLMNLFTIKIDGTGAIRLNPPNTQAAFNDPTGGVSWSPDGDRVAFVASEGSGDFWADDARRAVFVVAADGSDPVQLTEWGNVLTVAWSPDGEHLAMTMGPHPEYDIFTIRPDGSELRAITAAPDGTFTFGPTWSPDSSRLLYKRGESGSLTRWGLSIANADGTNPTDITKLSTSNISPYQWAPTP